MSLGCFTPNVFQMVKIFQGFVRNSSNFIKPPMIRIKGMNAVVKAFNTFPTAFRASPNAYSPLNSPNDPCNRLEQVWRAASRHLLCHSYKSIGYFILCSSLRILCILLHCFYFLNFAYVIYVVVFF